MSDEAFQDSDPMASQHIFFHLTFRRRIGPNMEIERKTVLAWK
jgi:hypothetical protein